MPNQYQWITYAAARQILASRLSDSSNKFWSDAECGLYLQFALRMWNALTEQQNADFSFTATTSGILYNQGLYNAGLYGSVTSGSWYDLASLPGSPRFRTVTDANLYTLMQYMLLENPTGVGTWTGTSQFSLADLQGALQRRRDEVIQLTGCNLGQVSVIATPNVRRAYFSDTVLEPIRARFVPASGTPVTLTREDTLAFDYFEPDHLQSPQMPNSWSVVTGPPLGMDTDYAPNVPGNFDVIALQSGVTFAPPAATLVGVPDDWSWLLVWGALADLLSRESEATDLPRAAYALKRYADGLEIMQKSNWLVEATYNGVPCDVPALKDQDAFVPEWEGSATAWPAIVQAGMDFIAPCPVATPSVPVGVSLTLVGNQPLPVVDGDYLQISRDVFDGILSAAQSLAMWKMGGAEAAAAQEQDREFLRTALATNNRLSKMGIYTSTVHSEGRKQDRAEPRQ
jgi:hypothetical protein